MSNEFDAFCLLQRLYNKTHRRNTDKHKHELRETELYLESAIMAHNQRNDTTNEESRDLITNALDRISVLEHTIIELRREVDDLKQQIIY